MRRGDIDVTLATGFENLRIGKAPLAVLVVAAATGDDNCLSCYGAGKIEEVVFILLWFLCDTGDLTPKKLLFGSVRVISGETTVFNFGRLLRERGELVCEKIDDCRSISSSSSNDLLMES